MGQAARLSVSYRREDRLPDLTRQANWRGITAEYTRMSRASDYAFAWTGEKHYLALHDLILEDGRMLVDMLDPIARTDLRNTMTYVPPGCSISGWASASDRTNVFTVLYFDPEIVAREIERFGMDEFQPLIYFDDAGLRTTMAKLQSLLEAEAEPDPILSETLGLLAAMELAGIQSSRTVAKEPPRSMPMHIERVRDYIEDNIAREITLDELAGVANLSRFHFLRAFKASVGDTPHRYVTKRRAEKAKAILAESRMSIGEIALVTGYRSSARFVRSFRETTGITPGAYRREIR